MKVAIVGCGLAGKTTLAKELVKCDLPVSSLTFVDEEKPNFESLEEAFKELKISLKDLENNTKNFNKAYKYRRNNNNGSKYHK